MTVLPAARLCLASRSPRRAAMLQTAGYEAEVLPSDLDDARLRHGKVPVEWWVMSLAYFKARRVADAIDADARKNQPIVLGADTLCALGRTVFGQPRNAAHATHMLHALREREHRTLTGICILQAARPHPMDNQRQRFLAFDSAVVRMGALSDAEIDGYIASGKWRGKAGAYNLVERMQAGWPVTCLGDPETVMGLPMQRLGGWLQRFGIVPKSGSSEARCL